MRRVLLPTVVAIALLAAGGCGSSSKKQAAPSGGGGNTQQATSQDASAKAAARTLLTYVETCFTTTQDYSQCSSAAQLQAASGAGTLPIGSGKGQVEVSNGTATGYTLVAHSKSGTDFTVTSDASGGVKRSCSKAGTGGCPAGGAW